MELFVLPSNGSWCKGKDKLFLTFEPKIHLSLPWRAKGRESIKAAEQGSRLGDGELYDCAK